MSRFTLPKIRRIAIPRGYLDDVAIALGVTAIALVVSRLAWSWHHHQYASTPSWGVYVLLAVGGLALAWRRRYPVAVLAVALGTTLGAAALGSAGWYLALIVAFVTAEVARRRAAALASLVIGYLVSFWPPWRIGEPGHTSLAVGLGIACWLITLLAVAALIVPAEQLILGIAPDLGNYTVPGIFFAAIAAGFGVDRLCAAANERAAQVVVTGAFAIALAFPALMGAHESKQLARSWPNSDSFTTILGPLIDGGHGHLLIEDPRVAEYYLPAGKQWTRWSSTWDVHLPSGRAITADSAATPGTPGEFSHLISEGYFSVVALNFADTVSLDHSLQQFLRANRHYHIVEVVPYGPGTYVIWRWERSTVSQGYRPDLGSRHGKRHPRASGRAGHRHRSGG